MPVAPPAITEPELAARENATPISPEPGRARIVIVGAGFGGLYAALALRATRAHVVLVDQRNFHLFQPLLYQVATAGLSPGDIAYPIRTLLRRQKNTSVLLAEAAGVDLRRRCLYLRPLPFGRASVCAETAETREELAYDFLILAPGSSNSYFGHPAWGIAAPGLKSLEDALEIRRRLLLAFEWAERTPERRAELQTIAVIGGGPTGVETAGAIVEIAREVMLRDFRSLDPRRTRVVLLEAGDRLLPAFAPELSAYAARALAARGVEVWLHSPVTAIENGWLMAGGRRLAAGAMVWSAGVAASALGASLGLQLERDGRVRVTAALHLEEYPEVFVIGDLAWCAGPNGRPLPGLAPVAMQQGRWAARNILRALAHGRAGQGWAHPETYRPFRYRDKGNLATIGKHAAVGELGRLRLRGWLAWLIWAGVHIRYLIGFRSRVMVSLEWIWAYFTPQRAARLITGEPPRHE